MMVWKATLLQPSDPGKNKLAEEDHTPHVLYLYITFHAFIFSTGLHYWSTRELIGRCD